MKLFLVIYSLGLRLVLVGARAGTLFSPKLQRFMRARRGLLSRVALFRDSVPGRLWWFHVASAGEMEQAIPLMENVRRREPDSVIYVSFFSPSAEKAAVNETKRRELTQTPAPWDYADYLCWDLPQNVRRYVRLLKADFFVSMHAELWPVLFHQLAATGVKISVGAVHVPTPYNLSWLRKRYWNNLLGLVDRIATIDAETSSYLQEVFPKKDIQVLGDPRVDRVIERAERNGLAVQKTSLEIVLASIEAADWPAIKTWLGHQVWDRTPFKLWVVPHEPATETVIGLEKMFREAGRNIERYSQMPQDIQSAFGERPDLDTIIVDRLGLLAELYARTQLAFVGGSFDRAVHNVLEPAAYAAAIVTGPNIFKSAEACEMRNLGALLQTDSTDSFAEAMEALIANDRYRHEMGHRAQRFLIDRKGVGERYARWLSEVTQPVI